MQAVTAKRVDSPAQNLFVSGRLSTGSQQLGGVETFESRVAADLQSGVRI